MGENGKNDDREDRYSCNRRLPDKSFGATALLMRLVRLKSIMGYGNVWELCTSLNLLHSHVPLCLTTALLMRLVSRRRERSGY